MKDCLKKRGLNVKRAMRMVYDRSEGGRVEGEYVGRRPGDKPLTLTGWHNCELPCLFEGLEGWKTVCGFTGLLLSLISWHDARLLHHCRKWLMYDNNNINK